MEGISGRGGISGFEGISGVGGISGFGGISGLGGISGFGGISGLGGISGAVASGAGVETVVGLASVVGVDSGIDVLQPEATSEKVSMAASMCFAVIEVGSGYLWGYPSISAIDCAVSIGGSRCVGSFARCGAMSLDA